MRRIRSLAVLTVLATIIVVLPVLPAGGQPPVARTVERVVPGWQPEPASVSSGDALRTLSVEPADAWMLSPELPADGLVMAGAEWRGEDVEVHIRSRTGTRWSPWRELHRDGDDAPDPGTPEGDRVAVDVSEPIWLGPVQAVQVRAKGATAPRVTLHGVAMDESIDFLPPELRSGAAHAAPAQPNIIPRSSWDPDGQCRRKGPPRYSDTLRFAVVHHTADSNDYTEAQAAARLLAVCLYHVNSRGYDDVAYNFFVDKYGRTYEGRTGGIREAVIGGHALGFNGGSTGVSLLGNYDSFTPPPAAQAAVRDLLAWKLDVHHVDPRGLTTEVAGADTGPYRKGELATFPTIVGHRDLRSTACPGAAAYQELISSSWLQTEVDALGGTRIFSDLPARIDQPVVGPRLAIRARISTDVPWELTIADASGALVRHTTGQGRDIDLRWDLRDGNGREVPPGRYRLELTAGSATPLTSAITVHGAAPRHAGPDAPGTAAAVSRWAFNAPARAAAGWPQSQTVVVGSTAGDAGLAAGPALASAYSAPLLLTEPQRLSAAAADEIRRLGARHAIIVGRADEVAVAVEGDLEHAGITRVERISGEMAEHTAGRVAWRVVERRSPSEIVLVSASGPNGATVSGESASAAAYAAMRGAPLALVQPEGLPEATRWVLEQRTWRRVTLVGGQGVVTSAVKDDIRAAIGSTPLTEIAGADRHATSRLVAEDLLKRRTPSTDPHHIDRGLTVTIASGVTRLDAFAAGAAAASWGGVFLLVDTGGMPSTARAWLETYAEEISHAPVAGGTNSVPETVRSEIEAIVRSAGPHTQPLETWDTSAPAPEPRFEDTEGNVHRSAIERVAEEGIAHGCTETRYCPDAPVTRAQMAAFLARFEGLELEPGQRFSDVPPEHAHAGSINAIVDAGIASGYPDGTYRPSAAITRAQMAAFLQRALDLPPVEGQRFTDVPAEHLHAGAINAIVDAAITDGCGDGRYCPDAPVTRAQMASFLSSALDHEAS